MYIYQSTQTRNFEYNNCNVILFFKQKCCNLMIISGVIFHIDDVAYFYYFYFKILWSLATLAVIILLEPEFGKTQIFFYKVETCAINQRKLVLSRLKIQIVRDILFFMWFVFCVIFLFMKKELRETTDC